MTTLDTILIAERLSSGSDTVDVVARVVRGSGGKGLITAAALAASGVRVQLFSLVSADFVPPSHSGLDLRYLLPLRHRMVSTWIVMDSIAGESHTYVDIGPTPVESRASIELDLNSFIGGLDIMYVTAETGGVLRQAAVALKERSTRIVVNLCTPLLQILSDDIDSLRLLLAAAHALVANESEWFALKNLLPTAERSWKEFPKLRDVVITAGVQGGRFSEAPFEKWSTYQSVPCVARCVVGAGDTFNGAYVASRWIDGVSLEEACGRAAVVASRKVATDSIHLLG